MYDTQFSGLKPYYETYGGKKYMAVNLAWMVGIAGNKNDRRVLFLGWYNIIVTMVF
jgi:hypothetical protein